MRISDWSSDVCSSDLAAPDQRHAHRGTGKKAEIAPVVEEFLVVEIHPPHGRGQPAIHAVAAQRQLERAGQAERAVAEDVELGVLGFVSSGSAESRVGKEGVRTCSSRWWT